MSMLSNAGGEAVADQMLRFIDTKLTEKLKRGLTPTEMEVVAPIVQELLEIKQACASGWY